MSYPQQGYPQQPQAPQGYPQQPPAYYPPAAPPPPSGSASPATAVIGLVLGLLAAAALIVVAVHLLTLLDGASLGDLPSQFTTVLVTKFAAAAILLVGALIVALRKVPGAVILALGGAAGVAAMLLDPVIMGSLNPRFGDFGEYLKDLFSFNGTDSTFGAIALITSPLVLILAILPHTLKWLRGSRADAVPQYAPQPGYSPEGYPQQGFGTPPGGFGQPPQQNYPQGQQGYPQGW
jgi:hypothetical protein